MKILVINSGSSSIKYQLFDAQKSRLLCKGLVERIGTKKGLLTHCKAGKVFKKNVSVSDHHQAMKHIFYKTCKISHT